MMAKNKPFEDNITPKDMPDFCLFADGRATDENGNRIGKPPEDFYCGACTLKKGCAALTPELKAQVWGEGCDCAFHQKDSRWCQRIDVEGEEEPVYEHGDPTLLILRFPVYMEEDFQKLVKDMNALLKKHNLPPINIMARRWWRNYWKDANGRKYKVRIAQVAIKHPAHVAKMEGYTYEGVISAKHGTPICAAAEGRPSLADRFDTNLDFVCHQCNTNRKRNIKAIFTNDETGDPIYLGSDCGREYWGIDIFDVLVRFSWLIESFRGERTGRREMWLAMMHEEFRPTIGMCIYYITKHGYVSQSKAEYDYDLKATSSRVNGLKNAYTNLKSIYKDVRKDARKTIAPYEAWLADKGVSLEGDIDEIVSFYEDEFDPSSMRNADLGFNMKAIMEDKSASRPGLLAWCVGFLYTLKEKAVREAAKEKAEANGHAFVNEPWGEEKERKECLATVTDIFKKERPCYMGGGFETLYIVKMKADTGHALVWFTTSIVDDPESAKRYRCQLMTIGTTYKVKGTIKRVGEYKGRIETVLTRVKVIEEAV